jgi:predicted aspartyl protease
MITGMVNAPCEALIPLRVQDANGHEHAIEAVIDTGYTGGLTLPPVLITTLGLTWRGYASAVLGDGNLQQFEVYAATVIRDGQARVVEIDAADTDPLVGMGLLYGYEVRIQAIDGGAVTIEALP